MTPTAKELVAKLSGKWHGSYGLARCPAHKDRTPSLSISDGRDGRLLLKCHGGCPWEAILNALREKGVLPKNGTKEPSPLSEAERERRRRQETERERDRIRRTAFVTKTWQQTWKGGIAAAPELRRWLQVRGIDDAKLDLERLLLRWSPRCPREREAMPAMIALMANPATAEPCGLHRTFLLPDGSAKAAVDPVRSMLGNAGIIRLSPDDEVELGLGISEGIETGLSIMAAGWRPIWACGSLGGLRSFPVLGGIECLTVFADPKSHELEGARACAARWEEAGREVRIYAPALINGDWNDVLKVTQ
jgi:hypothetical protein